MSLRPNALAPAGSVPAGLAPAGRVPILPALICLALLWPALLGAAGPAAAQPAAPAPDPVQPARLIADQITTVTGIAISPLLGVSGLGAWTWLRADESERAGLPWYADPWFFIPALALVLILGSKEAVLGVVPGAKKPLDALEVVENKLSALLIAAPLVLATTIGMVRGLTSRTGLAAEASLVPELSLPLTIILAVLFLLAFAAVWLAGQVINLLILVSPFALLDGLLKAARVGLLLVLVAAALIHPYLGAAVSLAIVVLAVLTARWTLRLVIRGTRFLWGLLTGKGLRTVPAAGPRGAPAAGSWTWLKLTAGEWSGYDRENRDGGWPGCS